ncbi:hypothetical protein AGMMS50276_07230 [Synergistales bacterium]|nr:hypothetical protein AGMMS50276_07230 [Synergistales bacterium]
MVTLDPNASNMSGRPDLLTLPNGGAVPIGFELIVKYERKLRRTSDDTRI